MLKNYNMQQGLNQNVIYKGETYHIQTEDSGRANPVITSHLFKAGAILATRKTSYADIIKSDKLDLVVKEIIGEQHKSLLLVLRKGGLKKTAGPAGTDNSKEAKKTDEPSSRADTKKVGNSKAKPVAGKTLDEIILEHLSIKK